jgi:hypothetical protein
LLFANVIGHFKHLILQEFANSEEKDGMTSNMADGTLADDKSHVIENYPFSRFNVTATIMKNKHNFERGVRRSRHGDRSGGSILTLHENLPGENKSSGNI